MSEPTITYNLTWGTNNFSQKLSGKTFVDPSGKTVDCNSLTVTFSSSDYIKKFYATAVKEGQAYGFEDDVLLDLTTGVKLHELTSRDANTNFSFTIDASKSLTAGQGLYRIGLYIQQNDGNWNYEYFFVDSEGQNFEFNDGSILQVSTITN